MHITDTWWLDLVLELGFIYLFIKEGSKDCPESIKNIFRIVVVSGGLTNTYFCVKEIIETGNREFFLIVTLLLSGVLTIIYGAKLIKSYLNTRLLKSISK